MAFIIKPTFRRSSRLLVLAAAALNMFTRTEIVDNLNFYQNRYRMFGYMQLTSQRLFRLHSISGTPLLWGPHNACSWDPNNVLRSDVQETSPCRGKMNDEFCTDELLDSCFGHFLRWNGNGNVQMDETATAAYNQVIQVIAQNAALGARLMLTVGKRYDPAVVTMQAGVSQKIQDLFAKFMGTCRGWVELVLEKSLEPGFGHLNVKSVFNSDSDFVKDGYVGDPVALFDNLRAAAPRELNALLNEGGFAGTMDGDKDIYFGVTPSIHAKLAELYRAQCISLVCTNPRLTVEKYPYGNRKSMVMVYHIDGVPVIPIADISYMDRYLQEKLHMAFITVSENINLGASFDAMAAFDLEGLPDVGMAIQRSSDLSDMGKYKFSAHALFSTLLADTDFFVGAQVTVKDDSVEPYAL